MELTIDSLLIYCAIINIFITGGWLKFSWSLWRLYLGGENGITRLMATMYTVLGGVWIWNISNSVKNLSRIGLVTDFSLWRVYSLVWIAIFYTALLVVMIKMDRRLARETR